MIGRINKMVLAMAVVMGLTVTSVYADQITLEDRNSTVRIDTDGTGGGEAGMYDWLVDGTDHLFQQWFWVRVRGDNQETPLHGLDQTGLVVTDTNPFDDVRTDTLAVMYMDPADRFRITIKYTLVGGSTGSQTSDIAEIIRVDNLSGESLNIQVFQYSDFDLFGDAGNEDVEITGGNTARQVDLVNGVALSETVVTPRPTIAEAAFFSSTRDKLNDGVADNLNGSTSAGTGDVTWAFQWDITLAARGAGSSYLISKDKNIVVERFIPEPATISMLALAGMGLLRRRRA